MARLSSFAFILLLSFALAACGGDSSTQAAPPSAAATTAQQLAQEPNAPQVTGNMATDGFEWFNFRRRQIGLPAVARSPQIDTAAQKHSDYQAINNVVTHDEDPLKPGFTGREGCPFNYPESQSRIQKAGYVFKVPYACGEVIAKTNYTYGFTAAEALITAIYHRFVVFEPMYKDAGAGYATASSGYTYFTTDFAANNGLGSGLGAGKFTVYPYAGQKDVPLNFFSDTEEPDPVPGRNEVGYPISVHADIDQLISVGVFSVGLHSTGVPLDVQLLASPSDPETPTSGAAIIPLQPLASGTIYDVAFSGSICTISPPNTSCISASTAISKSWSFTTQ